jgi:hypothetical protein
MKAQKLAEQKYKEEEIIKTAPSKVMQKISSTKKATKKSK